jgi:chromosome segregation ATPase
MKSLLHKASRLKGAMARRGAELARPGQIKSWLGQKLLAQKDRQYAELRENWLRTHEAFRLSQESLAQKDAALAQKDVELAELRADLLKVQEALRLAPERMGSQVTEFRDNWIKAQEALQHARTLLAQRDAQLAEIQAESNAVGQAFRLGQEMLAQKEAQLAKLQEKIATLEMKLR